MQNNKSYLLLWIVTVSFFAYQFILRLAPGVLMEHIMLRYNIDATQFALIVSFYYLGYSGMQIPLGMLIDKFGARLVVGVLSLIVVIGNSALLFSENWTIVLIGRFLIGLGSAGGVLGAFKAVRMHFKHEYVSRMIGWTVTIALLGAINGKTINIFLINYFGWQSSIIISIIPGILISIILLFFVDDSEYVHEHEKDSLVRNLFTVIKNPKVILLAVFGALLVGPMEAFADVWGVPFLVNIYGFSASDAAYLSGFALYLGMAIGSPILAWIVDKKQCHYEMNVFCGIFMAAAFYMILLKLVPGYYTMFALLFAVGIACAYQVIVFATIGELLPVSLNGVGVSFVNMVNMLAGYAFHHGIGVIISWYQTGQIDANGLKIYDSSAYINALYILPITLIIGSIGFFLTRPKTRERVGIH